MVAEREASNPVQNPSGTTLVLVGMWGRDISERSGSHSVAQKGDALDTISRDASDIVASIEILTVVGGIPKLREWLVKQKGISRSEHDLRGILFFMEVGLNSLAYAIGSDSTLGLSETHALARARFRGIDIDELPNDCEKAILLKRIRLVARRIRKCKTWTEIGVAVRGLDRLTSVIRNAIQKSMVPGYGLHQRDAVKLAIKKHLLLYYQNTEKGIPVVCLLSGFQEARKTDWFLADVFRTYVLCLEYVWTTFPFSKVTHSRTKDIERKIHVFEPAVLEHLERWKPFFSEPPSSSRATPKRNWSSKEEKGLISWMALDLWSKKLYRSEIAPVEKDLGNMFRNEPIISLDRVNEKALKALFATRGIPDPSYLKEAKWEARRRLLDYHFLWYEMDVLDKGDVRIFNGVPAFISLVLGACHLRRSVGGENPIVVRVFKHPVTKFEKGHEYSYALLMEVSGMLSDFSGWLVFVDCAGEYSGVPEFECQMARTWLRRLEQEGEIELKEVAVQLTDFKRYIQENGRVLIETKRGLTIMDSRKIIEEMRGVISLSRGKLFEYVVYKWLASSGKYTDLKGPGDFLREQIDCLGVSDSVIDVFECKVDLHEGRIEEVITQVQAKREAAEKRFPKSRVDVHLVVYLQADAERSLKLHQSRIHVIDNLRQKIIDSSINKSDKQQILRIMDYEIGRITE